MVFGALNAMVNTANAGLGFVLGQNYYKEKERFLEIYDHYSALYSMAVFIIMSVAYILMIPFVRLYTAGVTDINYALQWFPLLFTIVNVLSGVRAVASRLITVSGHAEKTQKRSVLEAIINIVSSLALVQWLGIYGVLLGTIVALLYRTNDMIIYANKVILKRNPWKEYKGILVNAILFVGIVVVTSNMTLPANNYLELVGVAIVVALAVAAVYICVTLLMNRKMLKLLIATVRNKTQKTNI
jgi:O-antigen/teichoic acid export membrane protein